MKKKSILILFAAILPLCVMFGQAPQAFKYQAIVRNAVGEVLMNQPVSIRIGIHQGAENGPEVFSETHQLSSNSAGMVNLNIGQGTGEQDLSRVDWSQGPYFLLTELDATGGGDYKYMGSSQLMSVPYALYSGNSGGWNSVPSGIYSNGNVGVGESNPQSLLEVQAPEGVDLGQALFVVKNNVGDTVFAVYNEGVRVTVPEGSKGGKGGFAVSGKASSKGPVNEIFRVTPDSVRVWVNSAGSVKGGKGGFAVAGRSAKGPADNYLTLTPENYYIGHQSGLRNTTGYYNTFFGYHAGANNTTGSYNILIGNESGYYNTDGGSNVFIGSTAGYNSSYPYYDIFIGRASGYNNTNGYSNIFIGDGTGYQNTTGNKNVYIGDYAGRGSATASNNIFLGAYAGTSSTGTYNIGIGPYAGAYSVGDSNNVFIGLNSGLNHATGTNNVFIGPYTGSGYNETGNNNVFIGSSVGSGNTSGFNNVFMGNESGLSNNTGYYNVFIGNKAGYNNTGGYSNVCLGESTGYSLGTGHWNVLLGNYTGYDLTTGSGNIFMGDHTGSNLTDASFNVIIGDYSALSKTAGNSNVILGASAGSSNAAGAGNIFLGYQSGYYETGSNRLYIENSSGDKNNALIYGEFDNNYLRFGADVGIHITPYSNVALTINPDGDDIYAIYAYSDIYTSKDAWAAHYYNSSDQRLKKNLLPLNFSLQDLKALNSVTFEWKQEDYPDMHLPAGTEIGLIAQDLEKVFPSLVTTDPKGFKAVDYSRLSVVLLKATQEQQELIEKQQQQISMLLQRVDALEKK